MNNSSKKNRLIYQGREIPIPKGELFVFHESTGKKTVINGKCIIHPDGKLIELMKPGSIVKGRESFPNIGPNAYVRHGLTIPLPSSFLVVNLEGVEHITAYFEALKIALFDYLFARKKNQPLTEVKQKSVDFVLTGLLTRLLKQDAYGNPTQSLNRFGDIFQHGKNLNLDQSSPKRSRGKDQETGGKDNQNLPQN